VVTAKSGGYHRPQPDGRWLDTRDGADFFQRSSDQASARQAFWPALLTREARHMGRSRICPTP
jgi:frataxin-like iron-binding protein CyaY